MLEAIVNQKEKFEIHIDPRQPQKGSINGEAFALDVQRSGDVMHIIKNNKSYNVEVLSLNKEEKTGVIAVNGTRYQVELRNELDQLLRSMGLSGAGSKQTKEIKAPMPGLVLNIEVAIGQSVSKGDALVILEAMKMENVLKSPSDGKVKSIEAVKGNAVEKNQVLITFE
ncbi:MAG TPA: acetyl-CoA carboxylase biotin carboxyl carrier protein subunit [Luteibaculaceae bacterium]|nr:acetyl-CoA carboxylase biotin carboxyl carrier protein subunit [Luteibaculaceae bacterium]